MSLCLKLSRKHYNLQFIFNSISIEIRGAKMTSSIYVKFKPIFYLQFPSCFIHGLSSRISAAFKKVSRSFLFFLAPWDGEANKS